MAAQKNSQASPEWEKRIANQSYLISTDLKKIDVDFVGASFAGPDMYWAKAIPREELALMLEHSVTLGLYKHSPDPSSPRTPSPTLEDRGDEIYKAEDLEQIGLARFTTDRVTFAYLTDVYVSPAHRAGGLGSWLMACCKEWMDGLPFLRRSMLMASEGIGKAYYAKMFGMEDVAEHDSGLVCMTKRGPGSALGGADKH